MTTTHSRDLQNFLPTIVKFSNIYYKKLKKPTIYDPTDLVNEGVIVFLKVQDAYKEDIGSFEGFFKFCLIRKLQGLVIKSYKTVNQKTMFNEEGQIIEEDLPIISNNFTLLYLNDELTKIEKQYLSFLLNPKLLISEIFQINLKNLRKEIRTILGIQRKQSIAIEKKIKLLLKV